MNKIIKVLLIVVLLGGIVLVARSQTVWASSGFSFQPAKIVPVLSAPGQRPGTVAVPPIAGGVRVRGIGDCPISVGGTATLCGLTTPVDVLGSLEPRPDGYLSKMVELVFTTGTVRLCFAAPDGKELIYFLSNDAWTPLFTYYRDGQACVDVSVSGFYVLGH